MRPTSTYNAVDPSREPNLPGGVPPPEQCLPRRLGVKGVRLDPPGDATLSRSRLLLLANLAHRVLAHGLQAILGKRDSAGSSS
jgi:hypothetical protein